MIALKIRCKVCGDLFSPNDETFELMSDGYISSIDINTCDECWDIINHQYEDLSDIISDADSGL
jgi:hypothetical protein